MKPPYSYYGGKERLISELLPLIPLHKQYGEVFCGGASLLFAKAKSENEFINDKNEWVVKFFRVCQTQFNDLQILIQSTLHAESEFSRAGHILKNSSEYSDLEVAWSLWVQANMGFGHKLFSGFAFSEGGQASATGNKRDSFTIKYHERLKDVEVFCRDAVDLIKLKDSENTFFYIDPPYVSSQKGHYSDYTITDFTKLLDTLVNIKGKFLLSSYPEEILLAYRILYNWNSKDIDMVLQVDGRRKATKYKRECLSFNYNLQQQKLF